MVCREGNSWCENQPGLPACSLRDNLVYREEPPRDYNGGVFLRSCCASFKVLYIFPTN
jgi:hypothetical protein